MPLPNNTVIRETDIAIESVSTRLGNNGSLDLKDLIARIESKIGNPVEVQVTSGTTLSYTSARYLLPDGRYISPFSSAAVPSLMSGVIDLSAGTVSTGTVPTFTVPTFTNNFFVKALIQYSIELDALTVTFGTQAASQAAAGIPALLDTYNPVALLELSIDGAGALNSMVNSNLIVLRSDSVVGAPISEEQTATAGQTVFTVTAFTIPGNRDKMIVKINGLENTRGINRDYVVTNNTTVTFNFPMVQDAVVKFTLV